MAERIIYAKRLANSKQIELWDNEGNHPGNAHLTTFVDTGDTVTWELAEDSGLSELIKIEKKANSSKVLTDPEKKNGKLKGTVIGKAGEKERYNIFYKILDDDKEYQTDPILQVNN